MIRTVYFACELPRQVADRLNRESGAIYSRVMVEHYRLYRKHGVWLSVEQAEKVDDAYHAGEPRLLHAHSIDAAQQGFYEACKTAKTNKKNKLEGTRYPHKRRYYRTTVWKNTAIRFRPPDGKRQRQKKDDPQPPEPVSDADTVLWLSLARGSQPVEVKLPASLVGLPRSAFVEMRLVYNKVAHHYEWHLVLDDGQAPPMQPTAPNVMAGDLGEVHPIVQSTTTHAEVITCRQLRAVRQSSNQRLAGIQRTQARCTKHSRRWWRLERGKRHFLRQQHLRVRDLEHKISRAVITVAQEQQVGMIVLGDVRDIADGKRLNAVSQQKISQWSHGKLRRFIAYKAEAAGIRVDDTINEADTTKTCPNPACKHQHKPQGRVYRCPSCGLVAHRDVVGAVNILSRFLHQDVAHLPPPTTIKYRYPHRSAGKRSPSDTGHMAGKPHSHPTRTAAPLHASAPPESQADYPAHLPQGAAPL